MMPRPNQNNHNNVRGSDFQGFSSEEVLHETKPNFWLYSENFLLKIVVLFLLVFMFAPIMTFVYSLHSQLISKFHIAVDNMMFYTELILILLTLVVIVKLILDILDWNYTTYIFTDARIIIERGFIHKEKIIMSYNKIQDIEIKQSLLERVINVGDIIVYGANEMSETVLDDIPSPKKIEDIIITNVNKTNYSNQNSYMNNNYQQRYDQDYINRQEYVREQYPNSQSYNQQYPDNEQYTDNQTYNQQNYDNSQSYQHNNENNTHYFQEQEKPKQYNKKQLNKEEILKKHDEMFKRHKK